VLLANHTTRVDLPKPDKSEYFAPGIPALLGRIPGNEALDLHIHEKQVVIPRLSAVADGIRIAHITDLHMSDRISKEYFSMVVDAAAPTLLAGNELPWYEAAATAADRPHFDPGDRPLQILLSHGPDQLDWAVNLDFDLMMAGHNHGGQVRLPILGAVLAPSRS